MPTITSEHAYSFQELLCMYMLIDTYLVPMVQAVEGALSMISSVQELADSTPPVDNKLSRFGNPAFRDFYDKVNNVHTFTGRPYIRSTELILIVPL